MMQPRARNGGSISFTGTGKKLAVASQPTGNAYQLRETADAAWLIQPHRSWGVFANTLRCNCIVKSFKLSFDAEIVPD